MGTYTEWRYTQKDDIKFTRKRNTWEVGTHTNVSPVTVDNLFVTAKDRQVFKLEIGGAEICLAYNEFHQLRLRLFHGIGGIDMSWSEFSLKIQDVA